MNPRRLHPVHDQDQPEPKPAVFASGNAVSSHRQTSASAAAAPRGALLYPRPGREGLEGRFLGLMADLDGKPEGDNSMPGK
jgi:hypothetical protein